MVLRRLREEERAGSGFAHPTGTTAKEGWEKA
jgi:hypothetical protein